MLLYLVTGKSQDEERSGVIRFVRSKLYGVFSDSERADSMAAKHGGAVVPLYLDKEYDGTVLQYWENPGFVQD